MREPSADRVPRPLTVVHVTSSMNRSGGTRQAFLLARGQVRQNLRIVVCAPRGAAILGWAREAGLEERDLPRPGRLWSQWRAGRALRALVREVGADLVHAHHTKGHNVALMATVGGGFPPVVVNRGVLFAPRFPAKFRSPRTAAIITNSRTVKGVLEGSGIPGGKIHVVPNAKEPADLESFRSRADILRSELGLADAGPVVGAVGRARPEKGFSYLVEASSRILARIPSARFVLVGAGTGRLVGEMEGRGVRDRFVLPGHREDAVAIMALFDVFVVPSVDMESAPNVLLEAMSVGVPAVGTDVGGIPEIIEHGRTGYVVPPRDPEALAGAVVRLLEEPVTARGMGRAGRRRVEEVFSPEAKVARTLGVYEGVLRQWNRRRSS